MQPESESGAGYSGEKLGIPHYGQRVACAK
jgi:hypothetical protein